MKEDYPVLTDEVRIGKLPARGTQNRTLAIWLAGGKHITTLIAMKELGICRLSERVRELQALGWGIHKQTIKIESGARVMSYFL